MEEERKEIKEETTKKEAKKSKITKVLIILVVTLLFSLLVIGIVYLVLFGDKINTDKQNKFNTVTNSHKFSGEILFTQRVEDYTFVTEYISKDEKIGDININFLYKNALVSKKVVAQDIDISRCSDYGIIFKDYNNDGMTDFSHIFSTDDKKSLYKVYTLTKDGEIILLDDKEYNFNSNKFSLLLNKENEDYTYNVEKVYYDGYEIGNAPGTYRLEGERNPKNNFVYEGSKISFENGKSSIKSKFETVTLEDKFYQKHTLLKDYDEVNAINIDLDNDGNKEQVVWLYKTENKNTRVILFDSESEVISNLVNVKGEKYSFDNIEFLDLDKDNIIEIITKTPNEKEVVISKYQLGYYFPEN